MKAIYNDNLIVETRDDADQRNLHECWALQKVIEGKALVIGGGITPIKQNEPMHDGVSLWLAEDPTENAEIKLDIIPDMMDGYPIVKIICAPVCPDNEEETPRNPAEADTVSHPTALERRELYKTISPKKSDLGLSDRITATKEWVSTMSKKQLEEFGHDTFNGKNQMNTALDTIAQLAEYDQNTALKAYLNFMETNLSGSCIYVQNAPKQ